MARRIMSLRRIAASLHIYARYIALTLLLSNVMAQAAPPRLASDNQKPARSDISQRSQIRFITGTDFFPFNTLSGQGRLSGYNIDLVRAICQELSATNRCQIEARPWDELLPALRNNEADALIAGLMPDREKRISFSFTRPYFSLPARFIAPKQNKMTDSAFSPDAKATGVLAGTAHEALLKSYFPKAKAVPYKNQTQMYNDLRNGRLQLIFGDAMSLSLQMNPARIKQNSNKLEGDKEKDIAEDLSCCHFVGGAYPAPEFLGKGMAIALRKQDDDLRIAFNNALNALERKGVLDDLYLRYFPVDFY
ncbi:transporter substrate-binding domain-containing protein [Pseudochrobactrum sp. HB0163]|uniref:transporter substrate-binding domain-containing protein n=1 Tax=Pseudochrobactrum sp. HB0163 TaxID=3450708 RepID=UPI003F6DF6EE